MSFEDPQNNKIERGSKIENTSSFQEAIEQGNLEEAENWLIENKDNYDARWLDHRSLELFRAYRAKMDYVSAKKMVELADSEVNITNRRNKLAEEAGIPYEEI